MDFDLRQRSCYCFEFPVRFDYVCKSLVKVQILSFVTFGEFVLLILFRLEPTMNLIWSVMSNVIYQEAIYVLNSYIG